MDPVTLASTRFQRELAAIWTPPPGHGLEPQGAARLVFSRSDRKDALKSLRIMEREPRNRRPFVIVGGRFEGTQRYLDRCASTLEEDYEKVRVGLAEDGHLLPALQSIARPTNVEHSKAALIEAATSLSSVLEGMVLVIAPEIPDETPGYVDLVRALAPLASDPRLRLLFLDCAGLEDALPAKATFEIDQAALLGFLKNMGEPSKGPPSDRPKLSPAAKSALQEKLGRVIPSETTGADLRRYIVDAGILLSEGKFKAAARKLRAGRMLCRVTGLREEEVVMSIAVGSASFAAGDPMAAHAAYRQGKDLALAIDQTVLAAQAEVGIAAVHVAAGEFRQAREHYAEIMKLAVEMPGLQIEALRMEGECFLAEGKPTNAASSFAEALRAAAALPLDARKTTSFAFAGKSLAALYERQNQAALARATTKRVEHLESTAEVFA